MKTNSPPPNYDYTAAKRSAARRERAVVTVPATTLDARHAAALQWILDQTDESMSALVRRLVLAEAERRGAPIM